MAKRRLSICLVILGLVIAYAVVVPWFSDVNDRVTNFAAARQAPSVEFWFGTDSAGRDLFVRIASAIRTSLLVALASALLATLIGVLVGTLSALAGGWIDRIVMRLADAANALPHLLLGIVIVALFRGNVVAIVLSIALTHWVQVARIVRSEALSLREREYISAAVLAGASKLHVLRTHILPAVAPQALIAIVLLLPHAVWHESTLSFLGFGLPPHEPSLGTLLEEARSSLLLGGWWTLVFPAGVLVITTVSVAVAGSALRTLTIPPKPSKVPL
ncbi:ABC transporter permease [Hoyosella subflava]|uniref:Putative ABC transporter permease protein n=1 Tax=Hoyosella subflava (strain DSM 45089 / JCM 17490 / NBRC 109087 / DQS3-9A1) TaxID=443218 RepID=F6EHA1_HOYSD|nr:ABC transporter permease [Hoyosella subflava]AEF41080.1 Putative ABC transporter permease protein [Hoyosella subflava DQS3-9A1]